MYGHVSGLLPTTGPRAWRIGTLLRVAECGLSESQQIALVIQRLARAILAYGDAQPEIRESHNADPSMSSELWYERYCLLVSQLVQMAADSCGFETRVMFGLFIGTRQSNGYPRPLQHAWLELPDGTIIDPTSAQMGSFEEAAIIEPSDPMYRHYRMRGWWREGEGELPPA